MENLIDGDLASNNGGWQWSASTGTDPQPYFRIFNPISQSEKVGAVAPLDCFAAIHTIVFPRPIPPVIISDIMSLNSLSFLGKVKH